MRLTICMALLLCQSLLSAQNPYPNKHADIDVQNYTFSISLSDSTNNILGDADLFLLVKNDWDRDIALDLSNFDKKDSLGMTVDSVWVDYEPAPFMLYQEVLSIALQYPAHANDTHHVRIKYHGTPDDGLVISTNKYDDRTFFGDNWPDRAHHWLPLVDHPSDKATCEWLITAPSKYRVVANGIRTEEIDLKNGFTLTHYVESVPIAPKVMVFGAARFAVQTVGKLRDVAVESWVYPQDSLKVFYDYKPALPILTYFDRQLGTYPYEKLANVQSKTIFGGMENAGTIFYNDQSVYGEKNADMESLLAHEIAHQWFGNCITEKNYAHIWLSEGFATYLSALYMQQSWGEKEFYLTMENCRRTSIGFMRNNPGIPVVDSTETELMNLLNANSYQKGAWALHMLRRQVGDTVFWKSIQNFLQKYRNNNAETADFQREVEQNSHTDLSVFFKQWLYQSGFPKVTGEWMYDPEKKAVNYYLHQTQSEEPFIFPLDIAFKNAKGEIIQTQTVQFNSRELNGSISVSEPPTKLLLDPDHWLLFEGNIKAK